MKKASLAVVLLAAVATTPVIAMNHGHGHGNGAGHASAVAAADVNAAPVSSSIAVSGCWIRAIPAPAPSGGYFVVRNNGEKPVTLVAAASPSYGMVMLHQTTHQGGMSRMSEVEGVEIASGSELEFRPGGYHAMLGSAAEGVAVGSTITLNLLFDNGEKAVTECEVKPANTRVPG